MLGGPPDQCAAPFRASGGIPRDAILQIRQQTPPSLLMPQATNTTTAATTANTTPTNIKRLGMAEFKAAIGAASVDVIRSPRTGKVFVQGSNGAVYRCQQSINLSEPVEWLIEDGLLAEACLINKGRAAVLASF